MNIDDLTNARSVTVSTREIHTATATVGMDTIEAEYFTFDYSNPFESEKMNAFEKMWDVITSQYYKIKWKIRNAYWECRYGFERMFKGYDSMDTFEIFYKFIKKYKKVLTEFRNNHYGYPANLTEEEWDNILDSMLYHLYYMEEDNVIKELEKDVPDNWSVSLKTINEVMEKHKNGFFKLFSEYFYNLWD